MAAAMRVGLGFDTHAFGAGRRLVLGGVEIPNGGRGLVGHSDADVVLHAIGSALLGAAALGDLGRHFPSSDPALEGIDSATIVERILAMVARAGWAIGNVDVTVIAQAPKLAPHLDAIRQRTETMLGCRAGEVSIKATSTDHLGAIGRGEGIAAMAVVSLIAESEPTRPPSSKSRSRPRSGTQKSHPRKPVKQSTASPARRRVVSPRRRS